MNKNNVTTINEAKNEVLHGAHFDKCPCCRSRDLIKFDVDYFCMGCDWNSVIFDVESGNFEKRIALVAKNRPGRANKSNHTGVIHLRDLVSFKNETSSAVKKQNILNSETKPFSKVGGDK